MGKFTVQQLRSGYKFNLKAGNGQIIATSTVYLTMEACVEAIHSVQRCANSPIEDQTLPHGETFEAPKYELYHNDKGTKCFRLRDEQGTIVAYSEGYTAKRSCKTGIQSVMLNAPEAPIITG